MLPEEQELVKLAALQAELEDKLASEEMALKAATAEAYKFRQRYYRAVGALYAELDELDAKIARAELNRSPNDQELRANAEASEQRAKRSAEEAGLATIESTPKPEITPELKQAYRRAVKLLHPDLALTENERLRRTVLMAQVNLAYERGDLNAIEKIMKDYGEDPEAITGEDIASRIVKTIRRIAQLRRRIEDVERELEALKNSDLYLLRKSIEEQEAEGGDPLGDLAYDLKRQIEEKRKRAFT